MQNMGPLNVAFSVTQNVCTSHIFASFAWFCTSKKQNSQREGHWPLMPNCQDTECYVCRRRASVHCKRYSGWREQWGNSFFFFSLFLVKLHSWRRAVDDNRRGCAPSGKTLAGETEMRTYGRVQWTDRETWTRLIISSCVINLDLNTIGREAQWTRHPTDRSICLHWWICSHTYMCTHAAAHMRAHTHTHPYKWAGWVSLCFAKLPNSPPR